MGKMKRAIDDRGTAKMVSHSPRDYEQPFLEFMTDNPTVFHAVESFEKELHAAGFKKLSERSSWTSSIELGGKYYVTRNDSSLIAFAVGSAYKSGNGVAMIGGHIDANTIRLKPVSKKPVSAGYVQVGVAPYADGMSPTWWDRDLGVGGKVLVKDSNGKTKPKLVKLGWPIARIPTLAPHLGPITGSMNKETQMVPVIGIDNSDLNGASIDENTHFSDTPTGSIVSPSFADSQPPTLVNTICEEMNIDASSILSWDLELFDSQPAQLGGLKKEFIFAGRLDDKLCSWAAIQALIASCQSDASGAVDGKPGIIKVVATFDNEEIGSLTRQGARGNFLPSIISRITEALSTSSTLSSSSSLLSKTYANSFLISADVTHAGNPNFLGAYMPGHTPRLNVGIAIKCDANGHMTTDSVSTAILQRTAEKSGNILQRFMAPGYSGGTIGPMLSAAMGVRAVDVGIPQLSMHSVRATTGNLDPGLGVMMFKGFFDEYEDVDKEFN